MKVVLDASAIIAFLRDDFGPEFHDLYVHALNPCEAYYDFLRAGDEAAAEGAVQDVLARGKRARRYSSAKVSNLTKGHKTRRILSSRP